MRQGSHHRPTRPAAVLFSPVVEFFCIMVGFWVTFIVNWRRYGGDRVRGFGIIGIFQSHHMSELGALGYIRRQSPSNNMLKLGAFVFPDAGALEIFSSG